MSYKYIFKEKTMIACCVEWEERSLNVTSFNIAIFKFIYFVPMTIIIYFNVKLIILVGFKSKFNSFLRSTLNPHSVFHGVLVI